MRRVTVVVRSWDGPNSRVGFEMDLNDLPWGPFDALGKKLDLLLPAYSEFEPGNSGVETEIAKALRHVEHAADRCGEFSQATGGSREMWLESQRTWEWVRRYLTRLWVQEEVEGDLAGISRKGPDGEGPDDEVAAGREGHPGTPPEISTTQIPSDDLPALPGAAATLKAVAQALRTTPLSIWRETVEREDPEAPTREEAIQTLLGVAKILDGRSGPHGDAEIVIEMEGPEGSTAVPDASGKEAPTRGEEAPTGEEPDFEQVSVEFAEGYDQGYQMGRKVGWALGSRHRRK